MLTIDRSVILRLETWLARFECDVVAARQLDPASPARSAACGTGALIAQGPGRYVNRAIGTSLDEPDDDTLATMEAFYADSDLRPSIEVSSWVAPDLVRRLAGRGYEPSWFGDAFVRPLDRTPTPLPTMEPGVEIVVVGPDSEADWRRVFGLGFGYAMADEWATSDEHLRSVAALADTTQHLVLVDGEPAACGSLTIRDGIGWLFGGATVPTQRGRGLQTLLITERLALAAAHGAELATSTAVPAGGSARNLRRAGFVPAHTRLVMTRPTSAPAE